MKIYPWQQLAYDYPYCFAWQSSQGEKFNWQELNNRIQAQVQNLHKQGVSRGNKVALWGKNSESLVELYLAIIQLGAVALGLNPAFKLEKIQNLLKQNQIDFLYVDPSLASLAEKLKIQKISPEFAGQWQANNSLAEEILFPNEEIENWWQKPATFTLTSGSTGMPKAVVHNVLAHWQSAETLCELLKINVQSSYLLSLPIYHISGQGIIWRWLRAGATLVFPQVDFYKSLNEVSHASLVPTQGQRWLEELGDKVFTAPKYILLGGSNIPENLPAQLFAHGIYSFCGYGMTEMGSTVFAKPATSCTQGVGQPLARREFRIIDGEIYVRGAGMGMGYWANQQIEPLSDENNFFPTKDLGIWQNGELLITGRRDNLFISGGENIQPEEIENIIKALPAVEQCVILPYEDKEYGFRPVAVLKLRENFYSVKPLIQAELNKKLEKFKHPIAYYLMKDIMNGEIKVSRYQLREKLIKGALDEII